MFAGNLKRSFGKAIRNNRAKLGISQEELADRAGLHRTYVSDVERGVRNLSLESIEKLADALELSIGALFARAVGAQELEILLVEDDPHDITLTLKAMRRARLQNPIHVVRDGREALEFIFAQGAYEERAQAALPGMILLDLNLPSINGLEVLRRLRADERTRDIPVVVLSVSCAKRDMDECRRLGVETYIGKPVDFRRLSEVTPQFELDWALVHSKAD